VNATPQTPSPRRARWVAFAFALALGGFTALTVRDAGRPAVLPAGGGTFVGRDVDGRLVQVCLFEQDSGWQGWLYREGREQTEWFTATNRIQPWQAVVNIREPEDGPKPLEPVVASTEDPLRLNATLPRTNGWASDTANLTRQFEHLSFRRRAGIRFGRVGGTQEYRAQFPRLPEDDPFAAAVSREMLRRCELGAAGFNSAAFDFWREMLRERALPGFNQHELTANWQLRLLTTNLASFSVWSHDATGGNGNHSHWQGANFVAAAGGVRGVELAELFRAELHWLMELRNRCLPKLKALPAPRPEAVFDRGVELDVFTLSPTGLQIYFNPYAIAPGADGEFVVHFDYAELNDLLRTDGPARLLPR